MMSNTKLPTSPHLQIYRLPLTALLSIVHRITGVVISLGAVFLVWVLATAAGGEASYEALVTHIESWYGQIFLVGMVFSLYLHFFNGIRHLFWDAGIGFELESVDFSAKLAIALAIILTIATWVVAGIS